VLDKVGVVWANRFKKLREMIFGRLRLALEVTFSSRCALLDRVASFLIVATITSYYGDTSGCGFCPFLLPLGPFLVPLMAASVSAARPPLAAASTLPRTKATPTASSLEACRVAP
jgi:hypothetical protein